MPARESMAFSQIVLGHLGVTLSMQSLFFRFFRPKLNFNEAN